VDSPRTRRDWRSGLLGALLAFTSVGAAESISYTAFAFQGETRVEIFSGARDYDLPDVKVEERRGAGGAPFWSKSVSLKDGFRVGAHVKPEKAISGFGLWIQHDGMPRGFSWEWFNKADDGLFEKLQGRGIVRATFIPRGEEQELAALEFLDDIDLRFQQDINAGPGHTSHVVRIKAGSVLRLGS
jgi:hypothetical protein